MTQPDSTFPIVIKPFKVDLSQTKDALPAEAKFTIKNVSGGSVVPTLVSSPQAIFTVVLPKSIGPGETADGIVRMKKDPAVTSFDKSLTIQLNDAKRSRFTIPVKRTLLPVVVPPPRKPGSKR